jgi:hypothetical protein
VPTRTNEGASTGGFAGWFGGHVHMSGEIVWGDDTVDPAGAPRYAPGILRVD